MRHAYLSIGLLLVPFLLAAQSLPKEQYAEDFAFFWKVIDEEYCYWDKKKTNWKAVHERFSPRVDTITSTHSFVLLLEKVINELYDHHVSLSTNTAESQRLVPSGTDIWAAFVGGKPLIVEVRPGFGAEKAGLKTGMEIVAVNDLPVEQAIQSCLPTCLVKEDPEARNYALRILLAGKAVDDRKITARQGSLTKDYYPDRPLPLFRQESDAGAIASQTYPGNIGYLRINDRLWDNALITQFDSVLHILAGTHAMILDLRQTPSGGNTTVARAIIGRFLEKEGFYQKHEFTSEEKTYGIIRSWVELVSPRMPAYRKPLVILVNHWTGSVGEGITIGFDAFKRARIIGTPMAGLNGAVYTHKMPHTGIGFQFPAEKLFHVNGMQREDFRPGQLVDLNNQRQGQDLILETALRFLRKRQ